MMASELPTSACTRHRYYQQAEIVLRHPLEHLFQRARERQSEATLFDSGAEFGAYGIGELRHNDLQSAQQGVAGFE